ncbi:hypothetical protein [Rufibacter latericius]|uniref:Uncharacterized protein n=1 Tax=Rufibacter latericius TaxID=2487040 RepID=A0A3M9MA31_9BACT|nr:hypothetical protein [Rufibacter latericius]RNI22027.1 hypothetical protein EFB08_23120 [Rufibacter latericius]
MRKISECCECNWIGTYDQMKNVPLDGYRVEMICPNRDNDEFFIKEINENHMQPIVRLAASLERLYTQEKAHLYQDFQNKKITEEEYGITLALLEHDLEAIRLRTNGLKEFTGDEDTREITAVATRPAVPGRGEKKQLGATGCPARRNLLPTLTAANRYHLPTAAIH